MQRRNARMQPFLVILDYRQQQIAHTARNMQSTNCATFLSLQNSIGRLQGLRVIVDLWHQERKRRKRDWETFLTHVKSCEVPDIVPRGT